MGIMDRFTKKKDVKGAGEKSEAKSVAVKSEVKSLDFADKVIVRPLVTEKTAIMQSTTNKYTFIVTASATKTQISIALKELYGVTPKSINIVNVQGRVVRFSRGFGRRSDYKKAIVTLPAGVTITVHQGV